MRNFRKARAREALALGGATALAILNAQSAMALDWPKLPAWFGGAEAPSQGAQGGKTPSGAAIACPEIQIVGGAPELRAPPGADASGVRYEIMLGDMARECVIAGDQMLIRVGVEGAAVLGPAGQPGAYYGNLRVALQRRSDDSAIESKTYRVGGSIPSGGTRVDFSLVADPISVPYDTRLGEDYVVAVALQGGPDAEAVAGKARKQRRRR